MSAPRRWTVVLGVLLADARRHKLQTAMTLLGVAVGVAVVVAIRLSSDAALRQFQGTFASLTGEATHELSARTPMPPERLLELLREPGVEAAQPVVAGSLVIPAADGSGSSRRTDAERTPESAPPRSLRLVGVDPFQSAPFLQLDPAAVARAGGGQLFTRLLTEPGTVAVSSATLERLGVDDGGTLTVRAAGGLVDVTLLGLNEPRLARQDPPFALADIATAQELLGVDDGIVRFDLVLAEGVDADDLALRPGERLRRPERRGERASSLTRAFRMNLLCLGFLAVLVGAFVAFNMAQFAVTRRRALLGRLRCMGCTARALLGAVLAEAALLGLGGGALGLAIGAGLARGLVADVTRTVSTLYGPVGGVSLPELDGLTAVGALVVGVLASVIATLLPARAAATTPPVAVAGQVREEPALPLRVPFVLALASAAVLLPTGSPILLPAMAVLGVLLASATFCPWLLGRLLRRRPGPIVLSLAAGRLTRSLGRTGVAAGALAMPLAMTIAVLVMVGSFRGEVDAWSRSVLGADVYVKPLDFELAPDTLRIEQADIASWERRPEVLAVDRIRIAEADDELGSFVVGGGKLEMMRRRGALRVLSGPEPDVIADRLDAGEVMISEPLARRRELGPGDTLDVITRHGSVALTVAAVFQDFSFDRGFALLAEPVFVEHFGPVPVRSAAILLVDPDAADGFAASLLGEHPDLEVTTVARLREDVLVAFEDTFALTWVLQGIATTLALVGVLTALLCLHLERRQELGVLRALGARSRRVGALLLTEATILTGLAAALAVPTGLVLAWILVAVVNTRSFGWSFPMVVEAGPLAGVALLAVGAGLVAGIVPWIMARRTAPALLLEDPT